MECVTCVCVWFGAGLEVLGCMGERIGFGLYQSLRNRGKVGYVSCFGCGSMGGVWGVGGRHGSGSGRVGAIKSV